MRQGQRSKVEQPRLLNKRKIDFRFLQAGICSRLAGKTEGSLSFRRQCNKGKRSEHRIILQDAAGNWFQFDYVPGESQFRPGSADYTGRICVIGAHIDEKALKELFQA